jgi:hypothetical protein
MTADRRYSDLSHYFLTFKLPYSISVHLTTDI